MSRPLWNETALLYGSKGLFAVGSEIKQFLDLPGFEPVLNYTSAVNFLCKGLLNYSKQTFFEGVKELRGGNYLVYNLDSHKYKIANWYNVANSITPGMWKKNRQLKSCWNYLMTASGCVCVPMLKSKLLVRRD